MPPATVFDALDSEHYAIWRDARNKHLERTGQLARYRKESLTISHHARVTLLNEQLAQATNDNIRRMRQSQIATAEADYSRRVQELDIAMERADITAQPVAFGVVQVKRGESHAK